MKQYHLQRFFGFGHDFKALLDLGERQGVGDGVPDVDLLLGNERQRLFQVRRGGPVRGSHRQFIAPEVRDGNGNVFIGDGEEEDNAFFIDSAEGLRHRGVGPGADNDPLRLEIYVLIRPQHFVGAEFFGFL
jgi:hypothetical protein